MNHLQQRLSERKINFSTSKLYDMAQDCQCDTAIIIMRLSEIQNDSNLGFYDRKESNGDNVILIVRNKKPYTIMFRRSNQKFTPESMRVNQVIDLS